MNVHRDACSNDRRNDRPDNGSNRVRARRRDDLRPTTYDLSVVLVRRWFFLEQGSFFIINASHARGAK